MSLQNRSVGVARALALCAMALFASCNDESSTDNDLWQEATVAGAPERGGFFSVAFSPTRGLAVGVELQGAAPDTNHPCVVAWNSNGTWARVTDVPLPDASLLSAVGFAASGDALMAGVTSTTGFILDERGGWSRHDVAVGGLAFAAAPGSVRLAGAALGTTVLLKSSAPDIWTPESLPFSTPPSEKGITDMAARNGVVVACGWDDGGEGTPESPNSVLFRNDGNGWERLAVPCGGCSNREFKAVELAPTGAILLGGSITDFSAGAPDAYQAFLLLRSLTGDWVEIIIPEPGRLDRVNDILVTTDGRTFLACGVEGAFIVREIPATEPPARIEATFPDARIAGLAEAPDGTIWAAGAVRTGTGENRRPVLWQRVD